MKKKYFARPLVSDCEDHNNRHLLSVESNQTNRYSISGHLHMEIMVFEACMWWYFLRLFIFLLFLGYFETAKYHPILLASRINTAAFITVLKLHPTNFFFFIH